jgi:hypothetical protein
VPKLGDDLLPKRPHILRAPRLGGGGGDLLGDRVVDPFEIADDEVLFAREVAVEGRSVT